MDFQFEIEYFNNIGDVCNTTTRDVGWTCYDGNFCNVELGLKFSCISRVGKLGEWLKMPAAEIQETKSNLFKKIIVLLPDMEREENDESTIMLPIDSGMLCHNSGKSEAEYMLAVFNEPQEGWTPWWGNMPIWGLYDRNGGMLAIVEDGKFDMNLRLRTCWGKEHIYSVAPVFLLREYNDEKILDEDISILFSRTEGSYQSMALRYREYNDIYRKLPSLKEKVAQGNNDLDYSSKALTVRCRMAVKELPAKVLEQTPETAPIPKALLTFSQISKVAKEFSAQKVGEAEFCLVGWNYGGHDGAFPQIFPVEKVCGGEAELKKTISSVKDFGYPLSLHDNYYDGYTLASNFDLDDACCSHDQFFSQAQGGGILSGGRAYRICAKKAAEKYAPQNIRKIASRFDISGSFFSDVISIIPMKKCYHPVHSLSRRGNAEYYKEIMQLEHDTFNVAMSEGARDWALPELDRAYMIFNYYGNDLPFCDSHIPFFSLVYHGFLIYNVSREAINLWPGDKLYLLNFAWGGLPMIYYHHIFNPSWGAGDGWENDLTYESPEKLSRDVANVKKITDDIARVAHLRYEFIEDYIEHSMELSQTIFSDGTSVWVNYSENEIKTLDGTVISARDFIVV